MLISILIINILSTLRCLIVGPDPIPPPPTPSLINFSKIFHPGHSYANSPPPYPANWFWSNLPSKTIFYARLLLCASEIYRFWQCYYLIKLWRKTIAFLVWISVVNLHSKTNALLWQLLRILESTWTVFRYSDILCINICNICI